MRDDFDVDKLNLGDLDSLDEKEEPEETPEVVKGAAKLLEEAGYDYFILAGKPVEEYDDKGFPMESLQCFFINSTEATGQAGGRETYTLAIMRDIFINMLSEVMDELMTSEDEEE